MYNFYDLCGKKVYVAGHTGLVGKALVRALSNFDVSIITASKNELDLRDQARTNEFLQDVQPDVVLLAAAKVGGIEANRTQPVEFLYDNLMIASNVIRSSALCGVERLMNLASNCYYPPSASQPFSEVSILTGPFEKTNEAYAIAKLAAMKLVDYYSRQYRKNFFTLVPTSLYGPGDHFGDERGHVIPALINRFHLAKLNNKKSVTLWGSGCPKREFLYIDDAADGMLNFLQHYFSSEPINLTGGELVSIKTLSELISQIVGYEGEIVWDLEKPDGMLIKALDSTRCFEYSWRPTTALSDGIMKTYQYYLSYVNKT